MEEVKRKELLAAAFRVPALIELGPFQLRPISLGTLDFAKALGLTYLYEEGVQLSADEMRRQVVTLLWSQTREPDEVLNLLAKGREAVEEVVRRFAWEVPVMVLAAYQEQLVQVGAQTSAATVDVKAKPGQGTEEGAPPNC